MTKLILVRMILFPSFFFINLAKKNLFPCRKVVKIKAPEILMTLRFVLALPK